MANPTGELNDLYDKMLGATNPTGAASNLGDIGQMIKFIVANLAGGSSPAVFSPQSGRLGAVLAGNNVLSGVSATWGVANTALFLPFEVSESVTIVRLAWYNGATVSGNVDCGIYNEAGVRQGSIGSTAQATISAWQVVTVSIALTPGRYLIGLVLDNIVGTIFQASSGGSIKQGGVLQQAAAFVLPANATFAAPTGILIPQVLASTRTVV